MPIPGSRKTARVTENIQAGDVTLTQDEIAEIDDRSAHLTVTGDRGSGSGSGHERPTAESPHPTLEGPHR